MQPPNFYDILNVSRSAPPEVIRAAYKTLSQKYHPDKFAFASATDKTFANNMMMQLNQAYQILSDPIQRREYDAWLDRQNLNSTVQNHSVASQKHITISVNYGDIGGSLKRGSQRFGKSIKNLYVGLLKTSITMVKKFLIPSTIILIIGLIFLRSSCQKEPEPITAPIVEDVGALTADSTMLNTSQSSDNQKYVSVEADTPQPKVSKTRLAPNGKPFPNRPKHLDGYPKLNTDGLSTITVDNSQNDSDIFGKLYYLDVDTPKAVRYFFIPAYGGLILRDVTKGNYDIRYKDLDTDQIAKSEPFEVQEIESYAGTQFSDITMTLYKVADGNMQTTTIPDSEF